MTHLLAIKIPLILKKPSDLGPNYRNSGAFSDGGGDELNTITSDIAAAMGGSGAGGGGGTVSPTNLVSAVDGRQVWALTQSYSVSFSEVLEIRSWRI